jgi:hypothetical protein
MNSMTKAILETGQLYLGIVLSAVSIVWVAVQSRRSSEALRLAKEAHDLAREHAQREREAHAREQEGRDEEKRRLEFCMNICKALAPENQPAGQRNAVLPLLVDWLPWAKWGESQRMFKVAQGPRGWYATLWHAGA